MSKVLISIVGSNPIPIYVLVKYLNLQQREEEDKEILDKPDKLMFVYSYDTEKYFQSIKKELKNQGINNIVECNLEENQTYGDEIINSITNILEEINKKDNIDTIMVNNTGGTKPMAVYSTMAVYNFVENKKVNGQFIEEMECYIDPSQNNIRINSLINPDKYKSSSNYCPKNKDLRYYLRDMDMKTLISLHDFQTSAHYRDDSWETASYEKANKYGIDKEEFIEFCEKLVNEYKDEREETLDELFINDFLTNVGDYRKVVKKFIKEKTDIDIKDINPRTNNNLRRILKEDKFNWLREILPSLERIISDEKNYKKSKEADNLISFLTGTWQELYMVAAFEDAIKLENLEDEIKMYHSFVCYLDESKKDRNFELDIVLLKGYELIAVTCTTDGSSYLTKMKSFEGLHRAEQIGGEHARLVIVNMAENSEILEKNLKSFNSDFYKNAEILCENELKDYDELVKQLREIIKK